MARITCRTPSTGKAQNIVYSNVPTNFTTIAEAPDFSVPDTSVKFAKRDPTDDGRAIRPGEIFFLSPLSAYNKDASNTRWIEVQFVSETGSTIQLARVEVPPNDTVFIPIQGKSLFKRDADGVDGATANGDRLQVRAEIETAFDVSAAAEEKLSNEHVGVTGEV